MKENIYKIMKKHHNQNDYEMCYEIWKEAQKKLFNELIFFEKANRKLIITKDMDKGLLNNVMFAEGHKFMRNKLVWWYKKRS